MGARGNLSSCAPLLWRRPIYICVSLTPHVARIAIFQYIAPAQWVENAKYKQSASSPAETNSPSPTNMSFSSVFGSGPSTTDVLKAMQHHEVHTARTICFLNSDSTTASWSEPHQRHFGRKSLRTNQGIFIFCRHAENSGQWKRL